jgi:hypothetical protein
MLVVGVVVLVGMLGAAAALWVASGERRSDNIANFARAPVGCDTTLDFEATGTFVLYIETTGEFDELAGGCNAERRYDRSADDLPELTLTLLDPNGRPLDFDDANPDAYDLDGFVGTAARTVEIETPGDHVLTVAPTAGDPFAVALGRSPDQGVALLRWGAGAAAIAGLVFGGVLLVLGSRRKPTPAATAAPWSPEGQGWPASPPGFPAPPPTTGASGPPGPPPPAMPPPPTRDAGTSIPAVPDSQGPSPSPWAPPPPPPT